MDAPHKRLVGRAGLKLEAALDRFALGRAVHGVHAVDVGASTGGFTQVLLEHGAASVVAVDAGHGQLHHSLREDARVQNLEGTDWKRLTLSQAPGPFDFFTVDVSFVAARNMLRGLAFRLRAGAEGVVLLKPQFELPDHLVRGGDVSDPVLRQQALDKLSQKAQGLGFRIVTWNDSPVAGGEGTVEILVHLRFEGRSEKLPQPGERRATPPPTGGRSAAVAVAKGGKAVLAGTLDWFAVAAPGVEALSAREIAAVAGGAVATEIAGGVEMRGALHAGMRANLEARIATRVVLRVGQARAREFGKLRHQLARVAWEAFLPPKTPLRITVTTRHCRLYHTGAIDETVRAAIGDRIAAAPEKAEADAPEAPLVLVRGVDDRWTISVDSSGERLHRRGWRSEAGEAPLRESLAAALLAFAEWRPDEALVDPMCGAGTIPIEAASIALSMAPGLRRGFAFERWPGLTDTDRSRWEEIRLAADRRRAQSLPAPIVASDRDPTAVTIARRNAGRAGVDVDPQLVFSERALSEVEAPRASGLLVANPPYGGRLGDRRDLPALYGAMGAMLRNRFAGWRAAVIVPDVRLASAFRLPVLSSHAFIHGGLRVTLLRFDPHRVGSRSP